ncbi:mannose-6-phosphate isomerase [Phanerochaete sordida]|uniref:Mannose-6-phosphate isomerase n=1 Tax=Phanerochaete sordida TaxID=48140 RepID=A0A9P3GDL3_9APHY|nr:mannose-6-phosphate isomerase [Phanerochaete sordida]
MSQEHPNLIRLKGFVQQYDWGKTGSASLAARLSRHALGPDFPVEETESYAEIWMGTHQNGPAHLFDDPSTSLHDLIASNPQHYLGDALLKKWKGETHVPFLFKVLSIEKALPLQVHPDRALAEELARKDPETFVDPNHKPEIAVCIGDPLDGGAWGEDVAFTGFVGFKPVDDICKSIVSVPELRQAIGDEDAVAAFTKKPSRDTLKNIYGTLLSRPQDAIAPLVRALVDRISQYPGALEPETAQLVRTVDAQYPGDAGVLSTVFFLNFVKLRRGEAVYIGADEVHAYLAGDIIECMAVSDNVLNAAFVPPRARQTADFVRALTFTARDAAHWRLLAQPYAKSRSGRTLVYDPPVEEFVVLGTRLEGSQQETLAAVDGPTIGIVTAGAVRVTVKGEVLDLEAGAIVYVVPGNVILLENLQAGGAQRGEMWWAAAGV